MNPSDIPPYLRRKRKAARSEMYELLLLGSLVLVLLCLLLLLICGWSKVKAEGETPRHDFPNTTAGTCMMFHEHPAPIRGDVSIEEIKKLCHDNGVDL